MGRKLPADTATSEKAIEDFVDRASTMPTRPVYMGLDTGGTGALALVCGAEYVVVDFPVKVEKREGKKTKKGEDRTRTVPDLWGLLFLFAKLRPIKERIRCAIEQAVMQIGGGGDNAYTAYRVCSFYFIFPLFLLGRDYKYIPIRPSEWKQALGVTVPRPKKGEKKLTKNQKKAPSVALAQSLFPDAELTLDKDGRSDALLLAHYASTLKFDWENHQYGQV